MNYYETRYTLDEDFKKLLLDQAANYTRFKKYISKNGDQQDLFVASTKGKEVYESCEINYLKSLINPKFNLTTAVFLKILPGTSTGIHIDESPYRITSLAWALSPTVLDFAPIKYYRDDGVTLNEIKYYSDFGILLNNKKYHAVNNNDYIRISVQLSFTNTIEELAMADMQNELFVK